MLARRDYIEINDTRVAFRSTSKEALCANVLYCKHLTQQAFCAHFLHCKNEPGGVCRGGEEIL